mmetsp:Transcript_15568/g.18744  ORF Transcript_15568/g.18744 Transcript_15568/m.18744 type:complete len:247 (+) Transcript_15568:203-943(+)
MRRLKNLGLGVLGSISDLGGNINLSMTGSPDFHKFFNIFLLGSLEIVSSTAMVRDIKTNIFLERINTEKSNSLESHEERSHENTNPSNDEKDTADLAKKKVSITTSVTPGVEPSKVGGVAVCQFHAITFSKQTNSNNSPSSVGKVDRNGVDGIVNLHANEELGETNVNPATNHSDDDSSPGGDNRATSSDGDEATESSIHGHSKIVSDFTSLHGFEHGISEHCGDTSCSGSNSGGDGTKSGDGSRS